MGALLASPMSSIPSNLLSGVFLASQQRYLGLCNASVIVNY